MSRLQDNTIELEITEDGEFGQYTAIHVGEYYTGETDVTPSEEEQVLYTQHKITSKDITVKPIPSNYGRIAWNGSALRVW